MYDEIVRAAVTLLILIVCSVEVSIADVESVLLGADLKEVYIPEYKSPNTKEAGGKLHILTAAVDTGLYLTQNVFRNADDTQSDVASFVEPSVEYSGVFSDKVSGKLDASLSHEQYSEFSFNNQTSYEFSALAIVAANSDSVLLFDGQYADRALGIGTISDDVAANASEPIRNQFSSNGITYTYVNHVWFVEGGLSYQSINYENTGRLGGGIIINDDRDHEIWGGRIAIGRDIGEHVIGFQAGINETSYSERVDSTVEFERDSKGIFGKATWRWDGDQLKISAKGTFGLERREFSAVPYDEVIDLIGDYHVTYSVDSRTAVTIRFEQSLLESALLDSSVARKTSLQFDMLHYYSTNFKVSANLRAERFVYDVATEIRGRPERDDTKISSKLTVAKRFGKVYWLYAELGNVERRSSESFQEYHDVNMRFGLRSEF